MVDGRFVLPRISVGMTEATATRSSSMPSTRSFESTTAASSVPIRQYETGWHSDSSVSRTSARSAS
ncbi:hypothetical protein A6V29_10600 [Blastococcus sp. CCUG 61487]|nr:hypothetical protein A6V29_10600 [Blastococcus sp. CCUG 61487]